MRANWKTLKRPRMWVPMVLVVAFLSSLPFWWGDPREDERGMEPHEVAVRFEEAYLQGDVPTIRETATEEYAREVMELLEIYPRDSRIVMKGLTVEEYEMAEDRYLYHLEWVEETGAFGDFLEVRKVDGVWRVKGLLPREFDRETSGMKPRIFRGGEE